MKPISITAAKAEGLKPVTEADTPTAAVDTSEGKMTFRAWCLREADRFKRSGRTPRLVVDENGKIALWAQPPPVPPAPEPKTE